MVSAGGGASGSRGTSSSKTGPPGFTNPLTAALLNLFGVSTVIKNGQFQMVSGKNIGKAREKGQLYQLANPIFSPGQGNPGQQAGLPQRPAQQAYQTSGQQPAPTSLAELIALGTRG